MPTASTGFDFDFSLPHSTCIKGCPPALTWNSLPEMLLGGGVYKIIIGWVNKRLVMWCVIIPRDDNNEILAVV